MTEWNEKAWCEATELTEQVIQDHGYRSTEKGYDAELRMAELMAAALAEIERLGNNLIAQEQITLIRNRELLKAQAEIEQLKAKDAKHREVGTAWKARAEEAEAKLARLVDAAKEQQ